MRTESEPSRKGASAHLLAVSLWFSLPPWRTTGRDFVTRRKGENLLCKPLKP
jgi:hypothetical protein